MLARLDSTLKHLNDPSRSKIGYHRDRVPGTFAYAFSSAEQKGIPAEDIQKLLDNSFICPVITAHPTEAKRVTVLEVHRRIYVLLKQLELERWTPREREDLITLVNR
jgi:phosphoenolpyruvate carboxylase